MVPLHNGRLKFIQVEVRRSLRTFFSLSQRQKRYSLNMAHRMRRFFSTTLKFETCTQCPIKPLPRKCRDRIRTRLISGTVSNRTHLRLERMPLTGARSNRLQKRISSRPSSSSPRVSVRKSGQKRFWRYFWLTSSLDIR